MSTFDLPAPRAIDGTLADALLSGRGDPADPLAAALAALRGSARRPAPEPSAALATLFIDGLPVDLLAARRSRTAVKAAVAAAGLGATLTLSGVAAAHGALPDPAQRVITDIINTITPFDISGPTVGRGSPGSPTSGPALGPSASSSTGGGPTVQPTAPPTLENRTGPAPSPRSSEHFGPGSGGSGDDDGSRHDGGGDQSGTDGGGSGPGPGSGSSGDGGSGDGSGSPTSTSSPSDGGSGGGSGDGVSGDRGGSSSSGPDGSSGHSGSGG